MRKQSRPILIALSLSASACSAPTGGLAVAPLPDEQSAGAILMKERCGQCHGAPSPSVHTAEHWPSVIYRMQNRMTQKGMRALNADELNTLTDYLRQYAKGAS